MCDTANDTTKLLVHALILSRVYYCHSLLFGASTHVLRRLQAVLNAATRPITGLGRFNHITSTLRDELFWLPMRQRIDYKLVLLVYKCLNGAAPLLLSDCCLSFSVDRYSWRSATTAYQDAGVPPLQLPLIWTFYLELFAY